MEKTINLLSTNVANYFKLKSKGKLSPGFDADFSIINLWENQTINAKQMHSKGKYTPFEGNTFENVVERTILRGHTICANKTLIEKEKYGNLIKA